jgi:hypothetical protein
VTGSTLELLTSEVKTQLSTFIKKDNPNLTAAPDIRIDCVKEVKKQLLLDDRYETFKASLEPLDRTTFKAISLVQEDTIKTEHGPPKFVVNGKDETNNEVVRKEHFTKIVTSGESSAIESQVVQKNYFLIAEAEYDATSGEATDMMTIYAVETTDQDVSALLSCPCATCAELVTELSLVDCGCFPDCNGVDCNAGSSVFAATGFGGGQYCPQTDVCCCVNATKGPVADVCSSSSP